jgi:hypothetical protein
MIDDPSSPGNKFGSYILLLLSIICHSFISFFLKKIIHQLFVGMFCRYEIPQPIAVQKG